MIPEVEQVQYALTLEEFAKDFAAAERIKEATQIHLVLYGKTKELALAEDRSTEPVPSAEDIARMEAEAAAMSDEELERAVREK